MMGTWHALRACAIEALVDAHTTGPRRIRDEDANAKDVWMSPAPTNEGTRQRAPARLPLTQMPLTQIFDICLDFGRSNVEDMS